MRRAVIDGCLGAAQASAWPCVHPTTFASAQAHAVVRDLGSDPACGLTADTARERLIAGGPNEIERRPDTGPWRILWAQLTSPILVLLMGAGLLSAGLGKAAEAAVIGVVTPIATRDVVPGDVAVLESNILSGNVAEVGVMVLAPFLGMPIALAPLQILWLNLVTDGLPAMALAVESPKPGVMARPPPPIGVTNRPLVAAVAFTAALQGLLVSVPALRELLDLQALGVGEWLIVLAIAATYLALLELDKLVSRRRSEPPHRPDV